MKEEIDKQKVCAWNNYIENLCMYETSCGNSFYFSEGTVSDNDFKFCPFCGKQIKEEKNYERV